MNFGRSGISKPVNKMPNIKENINGGSDNNRILKDLRRNGLRRSKSSSDLNVNVGRTLIGKSRLPMPVLHENLQRAKSPAQTKNQVTTKKVPAPRKLRPSMSLTDLRTHIKPLASSHQAVSQRFKPSGQGLNLDVNKKGEKRPLGHTVTKPALIKRTKQEEARSATSKPVSDKAVLSRAPVKAKNPPSYDYKARFNILQEKHKTLREVHAKIKEDNIQIKDDYETLLKESEDSKAEIERLSVVETECKVFQEIHPVLKRNYEDLTVRFNKLNEEYQILKENHDCLTESSRHNTEQIKLLTETNEAARSELEHLKAEFQASEDNRKELHNIVQDLKGNIRVFCRIRPSLPAEHNKPLCNINYIDDCTLELIKAKDNSKSEFSFNQIFPPQATQREVFEDLSQLVQSALDGYNVCVFAYGQTGSGKTYTMQGEELDSDSDPFKSLGLSNELASSAGMIPRSMHLLFNKIKKLEKIGWQYTLQGSFLEVYNESLRDLLDQSTKSLDIRYNEGKGVSVTNLSIETIASFEDFKRYMLIAQNNRAVATTNFNEHSSRSHAVTKVYINGTNKDFNIVHTGSINLIDLAGSESAKTSVGERLTETKSINKSLSALGNVMLALQAKEKHVPYRNSKLTYLLQSCLGGDSKTLMVVNISPFEECFNETTSSLRFAATVKEVKLNLKRNKQYLPAEIL